MNRERLKNYRHLKIEIRNLERKLELLGETTDIEEWIGSFFDSRLRIIIDMRYLQNKSWLEISQKFGS